MLADAGLNVTEHTGDCSIGACLKALWWLPRRRAVTTFGVTFCVRMPRSRGLIRSFDGTALELCVLGVQHVNQLGNKFLRRDFF